MAGQFVVVVGGSETKVGNYENSVCKSWTGGINYGTTFYSTSTTFCKPNDRDDDETDLLALLRSVDFVLWEDAQDFHRPLHGGVVYNGFLFCFV